MNPIAAAAADLMALGVTGDALVAALNRLEQAIYLDRTPDPKTEKRRAYDRDRKRAKAAERNVDSTGIPHVPTESVESTETLSLPLSPQTPQTPTHTRECVTTRTRKGDLDPEGFEAFWEVWPVRVGRKVALKAYGAALGRGVTLGALIAAVERDKRTQWRDRPPDKIPHASTWLNQDRWLDEPPPNVTPLRQPHERHHQPNKFEQHQGNLERAFAGAEVASRLRTFEPSGGF